MQLPALNALRRSAPDAKITAVGATPATELLEGASCVDEVLSCQHWGIRHLWDSGTPFTSLQIAAWLTLARFELALDAVHAPEPLWRAISGHGIPVLDADEESLQDGLDQNAGAVEAYNRAVAYSARRIGPKQYCQPEITYQPCWQLKIGYSGVCS
jgi:heptosyltransferase-3